jgi:ADP-heptose:LPS heptosyltransferase
VSDKKNICIIQFTRVGDILQTYQSLLNIDRGNLNFILVARKRFAQPIEGILKKVFSEIIYFDTEQVFEGFKHKNTLDRLTEFVGKINNKNLDLLVNLSFSPSSGYLATLINSKIKFGLSYDSRNQAVVPDKWSQYIYSNVLTGAYNPFSLVDLFAMMIGNPELRLSPEQDTQKENAIVIHPFASTDKKTWKSLRWAELLHYLFENDKQLKVYLVGAPNEVEKSKEIINTPLLFKYRNRIINQCGKTSIEEVNQLVGKSKIFIGHDSMIGHLAAINNVRALTISLGPVRPEETSPYNNRNVVFVPQAEYDEKSENEDYRSSINHKIVGKFAIEILNNPEVEYESVVDKIPKSLFYSSCRVYESYITEQNLFRLKEVTQSSTNIKIVLKEISRITWLYFHEEREEKNGLPFIDIATKQDVKKYLNGISHLYELSEFGKKYAKYILEELTQESPESEKLRKYSEQIDEVDKLQKSLKTPFPELSPILDYFAVMRANTAGETLVEITTNTFFLYNDASLICSIFYELMEKVLNQNERVENKPVDRN